MASLPTDEKYGFEDGRFQKAVDENFHCSICYNVLKEPRMCRNNEHIFCRVCIIEHLNVNSHTCPECKEDLTVDTLRRAPRLAINYLSELRINCDYSDRGCHEYIRLEELNSHVEKCGFAPVNCSNEECGVQVNKREIIHHESTVCEYRKVKCHSCVKIEQDVKDMQEKIKKESKKIDAIKGDVNEVKEIVVQMFRKLTLLEQTVRMSCSNVSSIVREDIIIVAGYCNEFGLGKTVERFSWKNVWVRIASLRSFRVDVSSFVLGNELYVVGGARSKKMEILNLTKEPAEWEVSAANPLYSGLGRCTLVYRNRVILIGGFYDEDDDNDDDDDYGDYDDDYGDYDDYHDYVDYHDYDGDDGGDNNDGDNDDNDDHGDDHDDADKDDNNDDDSNEEREDGFVDQISEVLLTPPYTSKLLGRMPEPRNYFAVELFEDRILIFGGRKWQAYNGTVDSVLEFDLNKNECKILSRLPHAISGMATVRWGDKIVLTGGRNKEGKVLNQVLMCDSTTGKIDVLPSMLEARVSPCAVITGNMIVVMGGKDAEFNHLASVEGFVLGGYSWEYLPSLNVGRSGATAALVPAKFSKGW